MRAVVQRVEWARVSVSGELVGACGPGLLVLVAAHREDERGCASAMADRVAKLRVFSDDAGKMNLALADLPKSGRPQVLAIPNFTLYGDATKSRRPGFTSSAPYELGREIYTAFVEALRELGVTVEAGKFGADMKVELLNDGPVTLILDIPPERGAGLSRGVP